MELLRLLATLPLLVLYTVATCLLIKDYQNKNTYENLIGIIGGTFTIIAVVFLFLT